MDVGKHALSQEEESKFLRIFALRGMLKLGLWSKRLQKPMGHSAELVQLVWEIFI
jgi:hypothetical protein